MTIPEHADPALRRLADKDWAQAIRAKRDDLIATIGAAADAGLTVEVWGAPYDPWRSDDGDKLEINIDVSRKL